MILPLQAWNENGIQVVRAGVDGDPVRHQLDNTPERVALDLHIGRDYQIDFNAWKLMPAEVVLEPNDCRRFRVEETITTSTAVFGQICSKGGYTSEGLLVANQKVDPNFDGRLELAVFNAGNTPVAVKRGMPFACLWFGLVDPPPSDAPRRHPTPTQGIEKATAHETWLALRPFVLTGVASTLSAVAAYLILHIS
jgi:hypothetical protein